MNIDKQLIIETILYLQNRPYSEVAGLMAKYAPIIQEINHSINKTTTNNIEQAPQQKESTNN